MTDEQIIKALECHKERELETCSKCPLLNIEGCAYELSQLALDLINRQKMKVIELEDRLDWAEADYNAVDIERIKAEEELEKAKAEIERLEKGSLKEAMIFNSKTIENATAEAIKEYLDKFDIEYCKMFSIPEIEFMKAFKRRFLKEMVGDTE